MDGFQLLETLKSDEQLKNIPVIMLTARVELRDRLKALRIGVDDYLTKPFIEEELFARIENLLRNAENRRAVQTTTEIPDTATAPSTVATIDTAWLEKLEKITLSKLENVNLVIADIAEALDISERQLYRLIKENVGKTPNQYIKALRLATARKMLEEQTYPSVKAIAISVGFKDVKYFSSQFKKEFGQLPSSYF